MLDTPDPTIGRSRRERSRLSPVEVVRRLGGRAERADVLRRTSHRHLQVAVATGRLVRPGRGVYALPSLPDERIAAAACRGVVSHESAAALLRLPLVRASEEIHVTVARGARPTASGPIVLHRRDLPPPDVDHDVTTPLRTVLDCCVSLPFREALAVADGAAGRFPGLAADLTAAADASAGPGRARRRRVAAEVNPLADNAFESALRGSLIEAGLTGFRPQVEILTPAGTFRVDLANEELRIVVEADSFRVPRRPSRSRARLSTLRRAGAGRLGRAPVRMGARDVRRALGRVGGRGRGAPSASPARSRLGMINLSRCGWCGWCGVAWVRRCRR
jgi:very-short-patch-repair endonuclease